MRGPKAAVKLILLLNNIDLKTNGCGIVNRIICLSQNDKFEKVHWSISKDFRCVKNSS